MIHLFVSAWLLTTVMQPQSDDSIIAPIRVCQSAPNFETCAAAVEKQHLARSTRVNRSGDTLNISVTGGVVRLIDRDVVGDAFTKHRIAGAIREYVVVERHRYADHDYFLIGRSATDTAAVVGVPIASPDRLRLLAVAAGTEQWYAPNALEIWRISEGLPKREFSREWDEAAAPAAARWRGNTTVAFQLSGRLTTVTLTASGDWRLTQRTQSPPKPE